MNLTETQLSSEPLYQGSFLHISKDRIRLPNGHATQRIVIRHPGAACILAVTDDDRVVLVRQWRYATGGALLEVPAGKLDAGEDPELCALRELAEETPYTAEKMQLLAKFFTAPGFCDELMYVYRAVNVSATSTLSPDQDEFVETVLMSREEVRQAIDNMEIRDAKTMICLQFWLSEPAA